MKISDLQRHPNWRCGRPGAPASLTALTAALAILASGCGRSDRAQASTRAPAASTTAVDEPASVDARFAGRDPALAIDGDGRLHVAYVDTGSDPPRIAHRSLDPRPSPANFVSPPDLEIGAHGEVPPVIEALPDGSLVVAYQVRLPGRFKGEIRYQISGDGGATWSPPERLHDDRDNYGSHSFLDSTVQGDGRVVFSWLDNRDGEQGMRAAVLEGDTVGDNLTVDGVTCQCCATALLSGSRGELWIAYRDLDEGDVRDIELARSTDEARSFDLLGRVSADDWALQGCPHTGPRIAEDSAGDLWVAWFTGTEPGIYAARSSDRGDTFGPRRPMATPAGTVMAVSHPELAATSDGRLILVYEEASTGGRRLRARIYDPSSRSWTEPATIAADGSYPRVIVGWRRDVLAYSERTDEGHAVVVRDIGRFLGG